MRRTIWKVTSLIAVLLVTPCYADMCNKDAIFAPFGVSQAGCPIHPSSLTNEYEYVGEWWGDPDFTIVKFAGFVFGTNTYCQNNEQGVSLGSGPREGDGLYVPTDVTRQSKIILENGFMGFDSVEATYSYSSRKLKGLSFSVTKPGTEEWYKNARKIFEDCIVLLKNKYGMIEPNTHLTSFRGRTDGLIYGTKSGRVSITSGVRGLLNGNIEVYLSVIDSRYADIAKEESKAVIDKPPTESIRQWVEGFKSKPCYFKPNQNLTTNQSKEKNESVIEQALNAEVAEKEAERKRNEREQVEKERKRLARVQRERAELKAKMQALKEERLRKIENYDKCVHHATVVTNVDGTITFSSPFHSDNNPSATSISLTFSTVTVSRVHTKLNSSGTERPKLLKRNTGPLSDHEKRKQDNLETYYARINKIKQKGALHIPEVEHALFWKYDFGGTYSSIFPNDVTNIIAIAQGLTLIDKQVNKPYSAEGLHFTHCRLGFTPYSLLLYHINYYWPIKDASENEINDNIKKIRDKLTDEGVIVEREIYRSGFLFVHLLKEPLSFYIFKSYGYIYLEVQHSELLRICDEEQKIIGIIDSQKSTNQK